MGGVSVLKEGGNILSSHKHQHQYNLYSYTHCSGIMHTTAGRRGGADLAERAAELQRGRVCLEHRRR